jgi:hypothetical protein
VATDFKSGFTPSGRHQDALPDALPSRSRRSICRRLFLFLSVTSGRGRGWTVAIAFAKPRRSAIASRSNSGRIAQLVEQLTLNQRVPGSSPGAPTIQHIEIESKFFERAPHRLKLYSLWFQRGSNDCARAGAGKFFSQPRCKGSGPPKYMDRPPPREAGRDRDPAETQPVKTHGISKVKSRCTDPVTGNHGVGGSIPPLGTMIPIT